jgi:hypothetical protein
MAAQLILPVGEGHLGRIDCARPGGQVVLQRTTTDHVARHRLRPTDQGTESRADQGDAGRLDEEIVSARIEQIDLVVLPDFAVRTRIGVVTPSARTISHTL